jgi:hypothetical protein
LAYGHWPWFKQYVDAVDRIANLSDVEADKKRYIKYEEATAMDIDPVDFLVHLERCCGLTKHDLAEWSSSLESAQSLPWAVNSLGLARAAERDC